MEEQILTTDHTDYTDKKSAEKDRFKPLIHSASVLSVSFDSSLEVKTVRPCPLRSHCG